jgi:phosphate/sulfate permease
MMGLPISAPHALAGGIIGPGFVKGGANVLAIKSIIEITAFSFLRA